MVSISVALGPATDELGSPCESPCEMNLRFRRKRADDGNSPDIRATVQTTRRQVPGFQPSSETSLLTREIAISRMRQLTLTPLKPVTSLDVAYAHRGEDHYSKPSQPSRRARARTTPESVLQRSVSEEDCDADVEDNSDDSEPDTDAIFGHWRNLDPFSKVPIHRVDSEDVESDTSTMLAAELPWHALPRSVSDDTDTDDLDIGAILPNGLLLEDASRSRPSLLLLSPTTSRQALDGRTSRRDSGPPGQHRLSRKWVNGVRYYVAEKDDGAAQGQAPRKASKVTFLLGGDEDGADEDSVGSLI